MVQLKTMHRHPVYTFHPYHTKVPPQIIRSLIEQFTAPGERVLDPFCGSGMTGVAAREAGREAALSDLSPGATFIATVNCTSHDGPAAAHRLGEILDQSEQALGWMYRTRTDGGELAVNYNVWSDIFRCPGCDERFPFFPHGVIHHGHKVQTRKAFPCPACRAELNVRSVRRVMDGGLKRKALVWVNAGIGRARQNRPPVEHDLELARRAEQHQAVAWYPDDPIPSGGYSARLAQLGAKGITDVSRLLSRRNLVVFADLWARTEAIDDPAQRRLCRATLTAIFTVISERQGYFGGGGGMSGNLYMPIVRMEKNIYLVARRKIRRLLAAEEAKQSLTSRATVRTGSATHLDGIADDSIDYVFTDPPFGANIIYSEVNRVLEAWLRVRTEGDEEAVIDPTRDRSGGDYAELMRRSFAECFRVLKPGRWMTVEFHNTRADVWNSLQQVLGSSGFQVERVGVLDKGSTTILEDIRPGAARGDLIISLRKPEQAGAAYQLQPARMERVWEFVDARLAQLPLPGACDDPAELDERRDHLLFDRMVAAHVHAGEAIPISAAAFYRELRHRYEQRDGRFYRPEQAPTPDNCPK